MFHTWKIKFLIVVFAITEIDVSMQLPSPSSEMLYIRHGKSRVRHSNEKDHIRWGLRAFDNLTLDYELNDSYENETLAGLSGDLWPPDNSTYSFLNDLQNTSSAKNLKSSYVTTQHPILMQVVTKKKLQKKQIMNNIRENVNKGLEYLKMHKKVEDVSFQLDYPNDIVQNDEVTVSQQVETSSPNINGTIILTDTRTKSLPHSVPARLSVPYKQQLAAREGETIKIEENSSPINLNHSEHETNNSLNLSQYNNEPEIPNQLASTLGATTSNSQDTSEISDMPDTIDVDIEIDNEAEIEVLVSSEGSLSDLDDISRNNRLNLLKGRDVVTKFLQIVESQHLLGANCTAGTALNLGEGVVDQYAQDRFRIEAEVAVNRANMLTRIFKLTSPSVQASEHLLHASVLSMVEFDDDIFAAGNCFDWNQHPSKSGLFCPFAYRLPPPDQGASFAKDLAAEYHYLGNTSEWFFLARKNAEKVIAKNEQYIKAYHLYSNSTSREVDEILSVKYEDGRWSKPYYDCGGGNIWMLTYTVPFFGYENSTYFFKGTSGIDIDLRRVDIDQCPQRNIPGTIQALNIFAGTDKCKQRTTMCEAITGLGFRRGSYKCVCRKGFYFPDTMASQKYFNGSLLEEEYEKLMLAEESSYNKQLAYECLPCAEGCDFCEDDSPCVAALNWPMRTSILVLACAIIGLLPPAAWFTFRYQQVKVVRAASPALLRVIALGAFFIYGTTVVMYPPPSLYTCTARIWLREIGFSLTYGALMLKTWRISVIFRVRSAKAVKITDASLLKRLGVMCCVVGACLLVRTIVAPPEVVVGRTADDLKAFLCKTDWWDYTFTSMEVLFLAWGVRLCIMVRKAPSEFNESRFISMAIYNEFLLTCFLNVSMIFLQSPANPDLLYIIFFCHIQLTVTLLLGLIFGSKVYIVMRSGKSHDNSIGMGPKSTGAKFNFRPQVRTFTNPVTATSSTAGIDTKLSDQEALEEIRQLSAQLQRIQELAPPKGAAVMTISNLLDGLKKTSQQLTLPVQPSGTLSFLSLKNYQQNNVYNSMSTLVTKLKSEKSVNTTISGEEYFRQLSISQKSILCNCNNSQLQTIKNCPKLSNDNNDKIDLEKKLEATSISFSELQLDCMCSEISDDDEILNQSCYEIESCRKRLSRSNCSLLDDNKKYLKSCDNHKSNEHFLVCDSCKIKLNTSKNIETNLDSDSHKVPLNEDNIPFNENISTGFPEKINDNLIPVISSKDGIPKKRSNKTEKLVLDLNDRSKYTKEVSV